MTAESSRDGSLDKLPLVAEGGDGMAAVVAVIRRLSIAQSIQEIMETVTPAARKLLRAGGITFVLREDDLCYYAEEDAISPLWKGKRFPIGACISGWCMREGRSVTIPDIFEDSRIPLDVYRPTFVRSLAMVPVRQDAPIAAMGAYWPDVREASKEEVDLLQTMANAAALALANIELRDEAARKREVRRELSHRIKNVFSVVQGLANQTRADNVEDFRTALTGRLQALETAHEALFRSGTEATELGLLIRNLLLPLLPGTEEQLHLSGPPVPIPAQTATNFAFVIHELGTNAAKYGAFSVPEGRVDVAWEHDQGRLSLRWRETGGPSVNPPERTGFGTTLVMGVANQMNGEAKPEYLPEGFRCELVVNLP